MNYVVLDIGGSAIKYALMDEEANFLNRGSIATPKTLETFIEAVGKICDDYKLEKTIEGLAVSMPCPVDPKTGRLSGGSAIHYIHGPNIKELFENRTGLKVVLENDGNCAGLAEGFKGNAMDCENYVVMVIGSGIGGTVVINNKIVYGKNLHAGEFGCMVIDDTLKHPIGTMYSQKAATAGLIAAVSQAKNIPTESLNGLKIFEMADAGDEIVIAELKKFYRYLATGIFNIQYAIDPEKILLGGAISQNKTVINEVNKILQEMKDRHHIIDIVVEPCKFLGESNLVGALYNFINKK